MMSPVRQKQILFNRLIGCTRENQAGMVSYSNMVLDVITFQTKDFLCHLSRTTKHSGDHWLEAQLYNSVDGLKAVHIVY